MKGNFPTIFTRFAELLCNDFSSDKDEVLFGDVAFQRIDLSDLSDDALIQAFGNKRWPSMHPELVPFAQDGTGNRFCFIVPHDDLKGTQRPIAYWMYETYRVVPIASSFRHFLQWIAMRTVETVERGVDPHINREHLNLTVLPLIDQLGLSEDMQKAMRTVRTPLVTSQAGMLEIDPNSPATLLAEAARELRQNRAERAEKFGKRAIASFPRFAAAHMFLANIEERRAGGREHLQHLLKTLISPICYAGDPQMPGFRDVPEIDLNRVVERIQRYEGKEQFRGYGPILDLIEVDDPENASGWLRSSLDYAQAGDFPTALDLASNALFVAWNAELTKDTLTLLEELYILHDAPFHLSIIRGDIERLARHADRRHHR